MNQQFNQRLAANTTSFHPQIMSCPDLDGADNFFTELPRTNYQPMFTAMAVEGIESYMISYDIYGKVIQGSPINGLKDLSTAESEDRDLIAGLSDMIEEEEDRVTEWTVDKENSNPAEDFIPRRRAQSDHFGANFLTNRLRNGRVGGPLNDITPASAVAKKPLTSSSENKKVQPQFNRSSFVQTPSVSGNGNLFSTVKLR